MLDLIAQTHGSELAVQVSEQFVLGRIRPRQDHQRMQIASRYGINNKKLVRVIGEMERNTEQPLNTEVWPMPCRSPGVSWSDCSACTGRHAQWFLFATAPDKARQLLRQTDMSVLEVSIACGFESASYFTRCYRARFERCPREDRLVKVT